MVQQLPFPRTQVGEVKIQMKETYKHLKAHIRHLKPPCQKVPNFSSANGVSDFLEGNKKGSFFRLHNVHAS